MFLHPGYEPSKDADYQVATLSMAAKALAASLRLSCRGAGLDTMHAVG
jgi:hypothetical protein